MTLLYETIAGSRLYGTNREDSDTDLRGVVLEPIESIIGLGPNFEQQELPGDHVRYGFKKFLKLALENNPNILDIFFAPKEYWITSTPIWENIYERRHEFLSQRLRMRYIGYARSQFHKLTHSLEGVTDTSKLSKTHYKPKHAAHLLRLCCQAETILTTGTFSPVLEGESLERILGALHETTPIEETIEHALEMIGYLEQVETILPKNPTFDTRSILPIYRNYINESLEL